MIPFPNAIAGIMIGIANSSWIARLVIPFGWAIVFCVSVSIFERKRRDAYVVNHGGLENKAKWGMSQIQAFYFVEYMTASSTSLIFSVLSGGIKSIFW